MKARRGSIFPRRVRIGCLIVRQPLLACGALYLLLRMDGSGFVRIGLLAAALHECGHIAAYLLLFGRWPIIEAGVTGLCLRAGRMGPGQRFWLAAAGPASNALLAALWYGRVRACFTVWGAAFLTANLLMGLFNLLPLPPLDGAQMLAAARQHCRKKLQSRPK